MMNSARRVLVTACFGVLLLGSIGAPTATGGTIELTLPDTSAAQGDTVWLPVYTTDVTDSGVLGYSLDVKYDATFVEIHDVTSIGTIS